MTSAAVMHVHNHQTERAVALEAGPVVGDIERRRRQIRDDAMNLGFGSDVDTARWLIEDQNLWIGDEPLGQDYLLLVASRKGLYQLIDPRGSDAQLLRVVRSNRSLALPVVGLRARWRS